jgi:hypothetical protein
VEHHASFVPLVRHTSPRRSRQAPLREKGLRRVEACNRIGVGLYNRHRSRCMDGKTGDSL